MAKSLRSKWKRKMKAIKRVRYGQKELARLEEMIKKTKENEEAEKAGEIVNPLQIVGKPTTSTDVTDADVDKMDTEAEKRVYNRKTMKDQHGRYPEWMSVKRIRQVKRANKKGNKRRRRP